MEINLDCWRDCIAFFEEWHEPLLPEHGNMPEEITAAKARLGMTLPVAVREWFGLIGQMAQGCRCIMRVDPALVAAIAAQAAN